MSRQTISNITVKRRLIFLFFCMAAAVLALILRLVWVQLVKGPELQERAWEQWTRANPARAQRGDILDRNGNLLAGSASSLSILARPRQIENKEDVARRLAPILAMEEERLLDLLDRQADSVYLKRQLDEEIAQEIRKLELEGIYFSPEPKRYYPNNKLASQLLGFVGIDEGLAGLENQYEAELAGQDGRIEMQTDGKGKKVPQGVEKFIPPIEGTDLVLTIDQNIQFIIEREMERVMLESEPLGIYAIAMDPQTGEVLGIAGKPDFDPNNYAAYPQENWKLTPISNTFEPGSTFKLVTLAAAIEEGHYHAQEGFFCTGYAKVAGTTIGCWTRGRGGHGAITFTDVVLGSCNPGFIELGNRIGADKLMEYVKAFGFGQKTGIDIIGEGTGILFSPQQYGPVEAATTSFGQGVSVTPIQQAVAVAAMVNGGYLMKPYVVKEMRDHAGNVRKNEPQVLRRVISEETAQEVKRIMELVVTDGSGKTAYMEGYRMGGKTGTAQKVGSGGRYIDGQYILSYIGFVPVEDPKILLYIAVDAPQVGPQWGSQVAAPMYKRMMESILQYMEIPPSTTVTETVPKIVEVPNLIGLPLDDHTVSLLEKAGLLVRYIGEGNEILNQTPKGGARVPLQTEVLVYLGPESDEEDIVVPDLQGKTLREATEILNWLGLRINSSGSGVIIGQDPEPQAKVKKNEVVNVELAVPGQEQAENAPENLQE
ncbi:MAG: PASTA domain-containing protein [Firmicutes bacterium]|nr:PASTA domain-containing protein [Bacillota bacterium]